MTGRMVAMMVAVGFTGAVPAAHGQGKPASQADTSALQDKSRPERRKPPQASYSAEVMVLHATNRRPRHRFSHRQHAGAQETAVLLLRQVRRCSPRLGCHSPKKTKTLTLPNGRVLKTKLLEVMADKEHLRISASINQPGGRTFLPLLEVKAKVGQAFIVAGQSYKGGIFVLVIRVVEVARSLTSTAGDGSSRVGAAAGNQPQAAR